MIQVEVPWIIAAASFALACYQGIVNNRRNSKDDCKNEASQLTTVIVKLENIGNGITEIKGEISSIKNEVKEDHDRIVKVEEVAKSAHKRLDTCEKFCKRFIGETEE